MAKRRKRRGKNRAAVALARYGTTSAAKTLGRLGGLKGGRSQSAKKVRASRRNGRKGGRPVGS